MNKLILFLIIASICTPFTVYAEYGCLKPAGEDWHCSGILEFKAGNLQDSLSCKKIIFRNGDILSEVGVEKEGTQSFSRNLIIKPSNLELSYGDEGLNIFGLLMPDFVIEVLKSAFPSGPDSVPEGKSVKTAKMVDAKKKEILLTISTDLIDRHQIKYSFQNPNDNKAEITGRWDDQLPEPLPDDYSVKEWKHSSTDQIKSLFDARSLKLEVR